MTKQDIQLVRREAQARINSMELEQEFLQELLETPLESLIFEVGERIRKIKIQIRVEQKYIVEKDKQSSTVEY